jgi:peptide chain release factor 1
MLKQLQNIEERYQQIEAEISKPDVATDAKKLRKLAQERAELESLVTSFRQYRETESSLEETRKMLGEEADEDMATMVRQEIENLSYKLEKQQQELKLALLPEDPNDEKDIIMEIRAGTGGEEAALFAALLFRMYSRYAQLKRWKVDIISTNPTDIGGFKEIIFEINGRGAFSRLKYERGVHRIQRVPTTESSGRIHTSTATVAVLPQAEEVDVDTNPDDLKIDIFHSGGAGGQNVNKVATAVRVTHLPSGMVVTCQDERSQLRNKTKALAVLWARLLDIEQRRQDSQITKARRSQVGSGERVQKIRTYNFPQDRITDHRGGLTLRNLPRLLEGELDEMIDTIATGEQAKLLQAQQV